MTANARLHEITALTSRETDTIRVFIRECHVDLSVGIYDAEMQIKQPVLVSVEMEAALPHHYQDLSERKLDRVIDYEPVYNFIRQELPKLGHVYLLETIAEYIITFCFRDVRIRKTRVRLEKTEVFPATASAGIDITRTRAAGDNP